MNTEAERAERAAFENRQRNAWRGDAQTATGTAPKTRADNAPESVEQRERRREDTIATLRKERDGLKGDASPATAPTVTPAHADRVRFDGKTVREIQIAVIKADSKDFTGEGKDDAYVDARFDQVVAKTVLGSAYIPSRITPFIHIEVIRADNKTFTGNGLSDSYVRARYHLVVDKLLGTRLAQCAKPAVGSESNEGATVQTRIDEILGKGGSTVQTRIDTLLSKGAEIDNPVREDDTESDSDKARKEMIERQRNAWRTDAPEVSQ